MKRDIKFRGKRTDNGEWEYGYCVVDPVGGHRIYRKPFDKATSNTYYFVIPETVGQYSGLNDNCDVMIFEGDIIREYENDNSGYGSWECFCVLEYGEYHCGAHTYIQWRCFEIKDGVKTGASAPLSRHSTYLLEVIGNIHDNPELLTKN